LLIFGGENWYYLTLLFALVPLGSAILFAGSQLPPMESPQQTSGIATLFKTKGLWLCVIAIFLGGASECTMAQWVSGYLEQVMGIPKVWGDVFGVAVFALMLGLGRTLYAKKGKDVTRVLLWGAVGAAGCYLIAAVSSIPLVGLFACGFTGFCVSMLWPGCLIAASDRIPHGGVFLYAMMAAGGDLGASISPQIIGIVTDAAISSPAIRTLAQSLSLAPEALGMKLGMLVGMLFPIAAIGVYAHMRKTRPK
jgi:fucose permease